MYIYYVLKRRWYYFIAIFLVAQQLNMSSCFLFVTSALTKLKSNKLKLTKPVKQTKVDQTIHHVQRGRKIIRLTELDRYVTAMTLEWLEILEIFWWKGFEKSKSAAQLLYGPVLVYCYIPRYAGQILSVPGGGPRAGAADRAVAGGGDAAVLPWAAPVPHLRSRSTEQGGAGQQTSLYSAQAVTAAAARETEDWLACTTIHHSWPQQDWQSHLQHPARAQQVLSRARPSQPLPDRPDRAARRGRLPRPAADLQLGRVRHAEGGAHYGVELLRLVRRVQPEGVALLDVVLPVCMTVNGIMKSRLQYLRAGVARHVAEEAAGRVAGRVGYSLQRVAHHGGSLQWTFTVVRPNCVTVDHILCFVLVAFQTSNSARLQKCCTSNTMFCHKWDLAGRIDGDSAKRDPQSDLSSIVVASLQRSSAVQPSLNVQYLQNAQVVLDSLGFPAQDVHIHAEWPDVLKCKT